MSRSQTNHPLCKPGEHTLSRRQLLGTGAAGAISWGGLGGLINPLVADDMAIREKQVLFICIVIQLRRTI